MFNHQNPKIALPLLKNLLEYLGSNWYDSSYGNDTLASISMERDDGTIVQIFIPNSDKTCESAEQYAEFSISLNAEYLFDCDTLEAVFDSLKTL